MKQEALDEMTELKKMELHVSQLEKNTTFKAQHITKLFQQLNEYLKEFDSNKIDEIQIRQTLANENVSLEVLLGKFASHCEHLNRIGPSRVAMTGIEDRSKTVSMDLATMEASASTIHALAKRVLLRSQHYRDLFERCVLVIEMCDFFAHECQEIMKRLTNLDLDFQQHIDGYKTLFDKLIQFSNFYDQFFISFGEMVGEVNRRRTEIDRQNQLLKKCQQELHVAYLNEKESRARFNRIWGHYLPPGICPGLDEVWELPVITPSEISSKLPDLSMGLSMSASRIRSVSTSTASLSTGSTSSHTTPS